MSSEAETNFRNRGIAYVLFNSEHLYAEPLECTDVYTEQCSVGVTCKQLAVMGSMLANDGVNPVTKERCLDAKYVPKVLSVMTMAGFYDGSGAWAWNAEERQTSTGRRIGPVRPARSARGARSPSRTCWSMWKLNSCSPIACTGETSAASRRRIPVANETSRQAGTRVPRSASVRTRRA